MYLWATVNKPEDLEQLTDRVNSQEYNMEMVVHMLQEHLSPEVRGVLLETNYVDKDYRSTYYGFYAKKGLKYSPYCLRLHFFKAGVSLRTDTLELVSTEAELVNQYVGYMVIRPTRSAPIGRTVLSIHAKKEFEGAWIDTRHQVHLLGTRFEVEGFPYMQQHTDISVCAHAACWSILRHYSQRYRRYAEFLVVDITQMASPHNPGGLIPSRGLRVDQACRVFSEAGLFPDVYRSEDFDQHMYFRLLFAYIESGFPVFAAMHGCSHAITVIGHGKPDYAAFDHNPDEILYTWDSIYSLVVIDDNHMPYRTVDFLDSEPYKLGEIDAFVVPLPEKIYFPAEAVEGQIELLFRKGFPNLDLNYLDRPVVRYFVLTSATFRRYLKEQSALPGELRKILMEMSLPQFVWMVQVSSLAEWKERRVNMTFLLDATASATDEFPYFFVHDRSTAFVYDRGDTKDFGWVNYPGVPIDSWAPFQFNLKYRQ